MFSDHDFYFMEAVEHIAWLLTSCVTLADSFLSF